MTIGERAAFARFHRDLAAAHERLARSLDPPANTGRVVDAAWPLGSVQQRALDLLDERPEGITASEAAPLLGCTQGNTHRAFEALAGRGLVTRVGRRPRRWTLDQGTPCPTP